MFATNMYVGETGLTTPPFFLNARRGPKAIWGMVNDSSIIVNWPGLSEEGRIDLIPNLLATDNWILLIHSLGPANPITPPFPTGA